MPTVTIGLGVVTLGIAIKMFLESRNILLLAAAVVLGGLAGVSLGIAPAVAHWSQQAQDAVNGGDQFATGLVLTSVLFCVGPMTILGCMQDATEQKIELLSVKSVLDGFASIIFAAAFGYGVMATALVVLVVQGALTLMSLPLRRFLEDPDFLPELTGTGGAILAIVGLQLIGIQPQSGKFSPENYIPALFISPLLYFLVKKVQAKKLISGSA